MKEKVKVGLIQVKCEESVEANINYTRRYVPLIGQFQMFFVDPAGNGVELNFTQTET